MESAIRRGIDYLEFRKQCAAIEKEQYAGLEMSSYLYGLNRCEFEIAKLRRLIQLADECSLKTAHRRRVIWQRLLQRAEQKRDNFKMLAELTQPHSRAPGLTSPLAAPQLNGALVAANSNLTASLA